MSELSPALISLRINRLKHLLSGRKDEYVIFGRTLEDEQKDVEINQEIESLQAQLKDIDRKDTL